MRVYKVLILALRQMVQWFNLLRRPRFRHLNLNAHALIEQQQKNMASLVHHAKDTAAQLIEEILYAQYQLELINAHKLNHNDQYALARHLGAVDSLSSMIRLIETAKNTTFRSEVKKQVRQQRRSEHSRPVI